jgi:hypothetical protein
MLRYNNVWTGLTNVDYVQSRARQSSPMVLDVAFVMCEVRDGSVVMMIRSWIQRRRKMKIRNKAKQCDHCDAIAMSQSLSSSSSSLLWSCVVGVPLTIPVVLTIRLLFAQRQSGAEESKTVTTTAASSSILAYLMMGFIGYVATVRLVPHIKQYTLRKGIFGKDLGKRGTATADVPM